MTGYAIAAGYVFAVFALPAGGVFVLAQISRLGVAFSRSVALRVAK